MQYGQRSRVGSQIERILSRPQAGKAPIVDIIQRVAHRLRSYVQSIEDHGRIHPVTVATRWLCKAAWVAVIDVAGFIADLKDHAVEHGFHVHDERHYVETYSMRQAFEVDLHPEEGCAGPLDLHLALELDPRTMLAFEDAVTELPEDAEPPDNFKLPLTFTWAMPPLPNGPDLLVLATELAGVGGAEFPVEVSAIDSYPNVTDASERTLSIVARIEISLASVVMGEEQMCDTLDRCMAVSLNLLAQAPSWLGES